MSLRSPAACCRPAGLALLGAFIAVAGAAAGCTSQADRERARIARLKCLMQGLSADDRDRREAAVEDIGAMGKRARSALPALVTALHNARGQHELERLIFEALGRMGPEVAPKAVPAIVRIVQIDRELEGDARAVLLKLGAPAEQSLREVLRDDKVWQVRAQAARLLTEARDKKVDAVLVRALSDREPGVRKAAAETLGNRGVDSALGPLVAMLADKRFEVALIAGAALRSYGKVGIERLQRASRLNNAAVSLAAARALGKLMGKDERLTLELTWRGGLRDARAPVRHAAVRAIASLGRDAVQRARADLRRLVSDPSSDVRQSAEDALAGIEAEW